MRLWLLQSSSPIILRAVAISILAIPIDLFWSEKYGHPVKRLSRLPTVSTRDKDRATAVFSNFSVLKFQNNRSQLHVTWSISCIN
jgi:hypothetical protein